MGKLHLVQTHGPATLSPEAAPNGSTPRVDYLRRAADGMNAIAKGHKKQIQSKCQFINTLEVAAVVAEMGGVSLVTPWPFYFRTGENVVGLRFYVGLVDTDFATAADPNVVITISLAADASVVATTTLNNNGRDAPATGWETLRHTNLAIQTLEGLDANTEYYVDIESNDGIRIMYLMAHEVSDAHADDGVAGIVDPTKFLTEGPIYDEHVTDLLDAGDKHWRHGGCHYLTWNPDYWNGGDPVTATTYTNVIDGTSTAYSSATPGVVLAAEHHGHAASSTAGPGVRIAVKAERTAGAGSLSVRLYNGADSIEITGITTGGVGDWYVASQNIPDGIDKWDIQAKVTAGTFDLEAVCVFAYEAGP
jgi:hypothetical protein